jgi:uncharacterized membrane protein YGL010W
MLGNRSWPQWIDDYERSHHHWLNRACHAIGIPMIAVSLPLLPAALLWPGLLWLAAALFVVGWVLQFIGHVAEGKPPEFFRDWRFLLVGLRWWLAKFLIRSH